MNVFLAALASGLAVSRSARGAQVTLRTAGQRPPTFGHGFQPPQHNVRVSRVGRHLFASPNAIKVGASSDHERSTPPGPYTRRICDA